ncbi:MAG: ribonuclease H family protein [Limosilactobacillus sp.]|uniref:ribonuclease H family protein n=1 Tax=Limosilactobacillus sp. TaxID=2773925 RepID=UPI00270E6AFE|nr:ribonuclease H family protein [Limosilactobacillus sp.]
MANKFYVVKAGRHPGIYTSWPDCQREVSGFSGAIYKSFTTRAEAEKWFNTKTAAPRKSQQLGLALDIADSPAPSDAIKIYTDGGSRNHGNKLGQHVKSNDKAAWAYLIQGKGVKFTGTDGEWGATNNRMEVLALINALYKLLEEGMQDEYIIATLDSHYVLDPIMKHWLYGWRNRGWKTASGSAVANQELWQEVTHLLPRFKNLHFQWTKGHADNDGNNIVDELLNTTMDKMGGF